MTIHEKINIRSSYPEFASRQLHKFTFSKELIRINNPYIIKSTYKEKFKTQPFRNIVKQNNHKRQAIFVFSF